MILLDTHVLLWLAAEPARLSRAAASAIRRALRSGGIAIASISLWEIAALNSSAMAVDRMVARKSMESEWVNSGDDAGHGRHAQERRKQPRLRLR